MLWDVLALLATIKAFPINHGMPISVDSVLHITYAPFFLYLLISFIFKGRKKIDVNVISLTQGLCVHSHIHFCVFQNNHVNNFNY